jgi:hypothetical protein
MKLFDINYKKRNNEKLFQKFNESLSLSSAQNYIPIYQSFFSLKQSNFNALNLNHSWHIHDLLEDISPDDDGFETEDENEGQGEEAEKESSTSHKFKNIYNSWLCQLHHTETKKKKEGPVFFKMAPLLDPFKYIVGKYTAYGNELLTLPTIDNGINVHEKIMDRNNSAYTDGLFSYLAGQLLNSHNFVHSVEYYGSFLAIKEDFQFNIIDDLDFLDDSEYFKKNKGVLFQCEDYGFLFSKSSAYAGSSSHNTPISITIDELPDDVAPNLLPVENLHEAIEADDSLTELSVGDRRSSHSLSSCSSCSSRYSNSSSENEEVKNDIIDGKEDEDCLSYNDDGTDYDNMQVIATIPKFPVHVICTEQCQDTIEQLIMNEDLSEAEWLSALMQIIFILLSYQIAFSFTHNDLHTNNIMYIETKRKYLYYVYKNVTYKVPTFGRIFKIIDFGRAIYKVQNTLFCSDSFKPNEDAFSQYNTEPYYNEAKPRVEPNYSFDLCRLACSMFDFVVGDNIALLKKPSLLKPHIRIITEWCMDDNGVNVLYKSNGMERYPDFKLYKMIARVVHNHTPDNQLLRPEFKAYIFANQLSPKEQEQVMNLDTFC